jgi:acyl dehydratase
MHLSEEDGRKSILGGLSASGFHTASMMMRMICDAYLLDSTSQGAPGVEFMNWRKPVLAGDTLSGVARILKKRRSRSKPGIGFVTIQFELKNQHGDIVCETLNSGMFGVRNPEQAQ